MSYHEHHIPGIEGATRSKRSSQESSHEGTAWTAARCNRLLRTITQRTTTLRRLLENCSGNDVKTPKRDPLREKRADEHWSTTDPVWLPDGKRKAPHRTYAAKPKLEKQRSSLKVTSTGLAFPSPFVRRIGSSDPFDSSGSPVAKVAPIDRPPAARRSRQLPIIPGSRIREAEQGLATAFSALLATTSQSEPLRHTGTSSLMSMCLRQVPAYIELNEGFESGELFTSEIFSYLEQLGVRENGGWAGLREVVRSQAVHIIRAALLEGLISDGTMDRLINICGSQCAPLEGSDLCQTWLEATDVLSTPRINTLRNIGTHYQCRDFAFEIMHKVGAQNPTRLVALCKYPGFWNDLLRSLASRSGYAAAGLLARHVHHALEQDIDASSSITNGVREMIHKLTTMAASSTLLERKDTFIHQTIFQLAAGATIEVFEQRRRASVLEPFHPLIGLLIDCALFVSAMTSASNTGRTTMNTATLSRVSSLVHEEGQCKRDVIAENIVQGIVELQKHLSLPLIDPLIERMLDLPAEPTLFQRVGLAALTAKRQYSENGLDEAEYQHLLQRLTTSNEHRPKTPHTPFRKNANPGYRWEDGICEWVTTTPFTKATSPINSSSDDSEVPPIISTPATEISSIATPDKENRAPISGHNLAVQKVALRPPPSAKPEQSPDILAMTPQLNRPVESPTRPAHKRARLNRTSSTTSVHNGGRGRTSGISTSANMDDSADELGF